MANQIVSEFPPVCRDCGQPLDVQTQADGKGSAYDIVTCWTDGCLLHSVTRSLSTYYTLTEAELDTYRVMNRDRLECLHKPLFDAITAHVEGCSGYAFVGTSNGLVCAEFRFPGGKFPLALDPEKPLPSLVDLVQRGLRVCQFISNLPTLKPLGV